jgi:hypothetical protein
MTGKLDVAKDFLATVLFPGLRVEIAEVEFLELAHGEQVVRLHLRGDDVPLAAEQLTAIVHVRRVDGDPHEWCRVELGSAS